MILVSHQFSKALARMTPLFPVPSSFDFIPVHSDASLNLSFLVHAGLLTLIFVLGNVHILHAQFLFLNWVLLTYILLVFYYLKIFCATLSLLLILILHLLLFHLVLELFQSGLELILLLFLWLIPTMIFVCFHYGCD